MTDIPDYTTMNGGEFRRTVGTDPEKWAAAFAQRANAMHEMISNGLTHELASWFRDAMHAARREATVTLHDD
jgi:hypothetical protein